MRPPLQTLENTLIRILIKGRSHEFQTFFCSFQGSYPIRPASAHTRWLTIKPGESELALAPPPAAPYLPDEPTVVRNRQIGFDRKKSIAATGRALPKDPPPMIFDI